PRADRLAERLQRGRGGPLRAARARLTASALACQPRQGRASGSTTVSAAVTRIDILRSPLRLKAQGIMQDIETFLKERRIDEVECLVPDMAGIARGKILPAQKFLEGMRKNGLRIPEDI